MRPLLPIHRYDESAQEPPRYTFEVTRTGDDQLTGDPRWAVIAYLDGEALGADAHWVRERYASRAADLYRRYPHLHGKGSAELRAYGLVFDPDAPDMDARYSHRDSWNRTHTDSARTLHRQTNGWTSVYDADADEFKVRSPEGEHRAYRRVPEARYVVEYANTGEGAWPHTLKLGMDARATGGHSTDVRYFDSHELATMAARRLFSATYTAWRVVKASEL